MNTFYESMPLPIYLLLTIGGSFAIGIYFLRRTYEYPTTLIFGTTFLALSSLIAGIVRILKEFNIDGKYSIYLGLAPMPFVLGSILFICIGSYQKVKHDESKRRVVLFVSIGLALIVLYVTLLTIFLVMR
ncbi:hypothetical protein [Paenibacillus herberti]|uniref:hypothetical protein n=1 Tax=Paenibacillus herberti TaxID=1619309 RepID=UPI00113064FE|nr:hypothetical protein [Paenibacillus herberti]